MKNEKWKIVLCLLLTAYCLLLSAYCLLFLLARIVFYSKSLLDQLEVSLCQIKVCSRDNSLALIGSNPINHLRRVCSQVGSVGLVQRLTIFAGKDPNVCVLAFANVIQVGLETGLGCGRG